MSVPLPTTTVTITGVRPQSAADPDAAGYDPQPAPAVIATGVPACISAPQVARVDGQPRQDQIWTLRADPCDLTRFDTVTDETTSVVYEVHAVDHSRVTAFGLEHVRADLRITEGAAV